MKSFVNKHKYYLLAIVIFFVVLAYFLVQNLGNNKPYPIQTSNDHSPFWQSQESLAQLVKSISSMSSIDNSMPISSNSTDKIISGIKIEESKIVKSNPDIKEVPNIKPIESITAIESNNIDTKNNPQDQSLDESSQVDENKEPISKAKNTNYKSSNCDTRKSNQMLEILNNYRVENVKRKLSLTPDLNQIACAHSEWMTQSGVFSHTGLNQTNPFERCKLAGTYCSAENLAQNSLGNHKLLSINSKKAHNTTITCSILTILRQVLVFLEIM
jgi:uncharacterized protein YkwD